MKSEPEKQVFVFPYYFGPAVARYGTCLLWTGELLVPVPGWLTGDPERSFFEVASRAHQLSHDLNPVFARVARHFILARRQAQDAVANFAPLGKRIMRLTVVGPGTQDSFEALEPLREVCLPFLGATLSDTQQVNAMSVQFVWRVHDTFLESKEDADAVLSTLSSWSKRIGSPDSLLLECALHRCHALVAQGKASIATDSEPLLAALSGLGTPMLEGNEIENARIAQVSFTLFDALFDEYVPLLQPPYVARLAELMKQKADALDSARRKCTHEAGRLVQDSPSEDALSSAIQEAVAHLRDEVTSILDVDTATFSQLVQRLTEDKVLWTSLAGLIGGTLGSLPAVIPASAAITALVTLGTSALRASRERREALMNSPWSFAYHLRKKAGW